MNHNNNRSHQAAFAFEELIMKKVLITGAASGLGRAMALRYAREGAHICIADINMEGAAETLSPCTCRR